MPRRSDAQHDLSLAHGSSRERVVKSYLKRVRGIVVFGMEQFDNERAPLIDIGDLKRAAPDLFLWSDGKSYFGEVKAKNRWTRDPDRPRVLETGFNVSSFEAYCRLQDATSAEIELFWVHEIEEPTGLFTAKLSEIRKAGRVWDGRRQDGTWTGKPPIRLWTLENIARVCDLSSLPEWSSASGRVRTVRDLTWRIDGREVVLPSGTNLECHAPTSEEHRRQPNCVVVTFMERRRWIMADALEGLNDLGEKAIAAASEQVTERASEFVPSAGEIQARNIARKWADEYLDADDECPPDDWALAQIYRFDLVLRGELVVSRRTKGDLPPLLTLKALRTWVARGSTAAREWSAAQRAAWERARATHAVDTSKFDRIRAEIEADRQALPEAAE